MLQDKVFLTQTDTTIGFLSQNANKLTLIKQRPPHKHYITAVNTLKTLQNFTRIPHIHKNRVRRSNKTTFILPNKRSYRVIHDKHHLQLLNRLQWAYTSSANLSNQNYNETFVREVADIIIEPLQAYTKSSTIYKLGKQMIKRVR